MKSGFTLLLFIYPALKLRRLFYAVYFIMKSVASLSLFALVLISFGCKKEEIKLEVSPSEIAVYTEGTQQITANVDEVQYSSQDEFYASVDPTGLVTGNKVGSTEIHVSSSAGTARIPVTIMSKYSLYPDLDGLIGKGLSDITKVMGSNYTSSTASTGDPMYTFMNPTSYASGIMFILKNNVCSSILVAVPTTHTSMLTKHLIERYSIAGTQNGYYFFLNHDKKVVIGLSVYSASLLAVLYMENTSTKAVETIDSSIIEEYRSIYVE